ALGAPDDDFVSRGVAAGDGVGGEVSQVKIAGRIDGEASGIIGQFGTNSSDRAVGSDAANGSVDHGVAVGIDVEEVGGAVVIFGEVGGYFKTGRGAHPVENLKGRAAGQRAPGAV